MDFSCYYKDCEDKCDLELLNAVSASIESFIEDDDKYQMFVHIPVEEFGVGEQSVTNSRWDRFVRATIETVCQYYTEEFKSKNEAYFHKYARLGNRKGRGTCRVNGEIINPNTPEIEHAIQRFEGRGFASDKGTKYRNRFLVNSYTNVGGGMMAMPQTSIEGLYSPCKFINGQLRVNDIRDYDIAIIIGDHFYSESFINDVSQDLFNRNASTKLIVMGTYRPNIQWCSEYKIQLKDLEKIYDFRFAEVVTHNLRWDNLVSFREKVRNFLAENIDKEESVDTHRIEKLLISPFVHNILPIVRENYRIYLNRLFEDNEYCNYLSNSINSDRIMSMCEAAELFDDSPKYRQYNDIYRANKCDQICVVNYELPDTLDNNHFIKVRCKDNNPTRGVKRNKNRRCFILYTHHKNTLSLLERYCVRGTIHILTYQGFDGSQEESSADWYGWENYYPRKGYTHKQQYYDVTLENQSTKRIYGSVIFDNKIISADELCSIIGDKANDDVYRVTICNDNPDLLDRYITARYPTNISNYGVSWVDLLREKLGDSKDEKVQKRLWEECKKYGYKSKYNTFERYFSNAIAYPKKYDDLKAILNFLGLDETNKRSIIIAAHNHNLKGSRGKEMKEEILNYRLTGERTYIDDDYNGLLEELFVVKIKKA